MSTVESRSALLRYINEYWADLIRYNPDDSKTLIGLPYRYLVPSNGEMFQEMYYWDSYFMSVGLLETKYEELIIEMTQNLAYLYGRFGVIPNASRYYFLSRSQPPFFSKMIWLAFDVMHKNSDPRAEGFLRKMMPIAEEEYQTVWMGERQPHHRLMLNGLSRYFDANFLDDLASCESGWDHSNRCDSRWMHHLPVCLNSILYGCEMDFARAALFLGDANSAEQWRQRASDRAENMVRLMWNEEEAFFFDYDVENLCQNREPSLAGFYPLWAGLATFSQAEKLVKSWLPKFEREGGLITSLQAQMHKQWASPNGWAPLQWLVTEGLERYGYEEDADRIRQKWCLNNQRVFELTGQMWEKYNVIECDKFPEEGLYGSISGFGWTNSVFVYFQRKLSNRNDAGQSHSRTQACAS